MIELAIFEKLMLERILEMDKIAFSTKDAESFVVEVLALFRFVPVDFGGLVNGFFSVSEGTPNVNIEIIYFSAVSNFVNFLVSL